jgi:hypothetical protein
MLGLIQDGLLRALSPQRIPPGLFSIDLPKGVEIRVNRWLLERHWRILGVTALAGCANRTILVHPRLLRFARDDIDAVLRQHSPTLPSSLFGACSERIHGTSASGSATATSTTNSSAKLAMPRQSRSDRIRRRGGIR